MTEKIKIKPLGNRVVLLPEKEEKVTKSGIILADSGKNEKKNIGKILVVSENLKEKLKEGDKVFFSDYGYEEIEMDGEKYFIVPEDKIYAIIN